MNPIEFQNNNWIMKGDITLNQVPSIIKLTIGYEWKNSVLIDLIEVEEVDTSLLGLIFEWKRQAKKYNKTVSVKNTPANLESLAKLYGVEEFIS
ncbi:STAS domain-containing protein [Methylophilaceae bacterium]|jgi:phospholipid transport system transporter-binding protein|nr:STAS domain-containing protein [Methylophilaceae bacterium]